MKYDDPDRLTMPEQKTPTPGGEKQGYDLYKAIINGLTKDDKLVLNTCEVAKLLDTTDNRVREWCHDPTTNFPFIYVGRNIKIPKQELLQWLHDEVDRQRAERLTQLQSVRRNIPHIY